MFKFDHINEIQEREDLEESSSETTLGEDDGSEKKAVQFQLMSIGK